MSNKAHAEGGVKRPIQQRRSRVLYGASRPHTECFITHAAHTVHAITVFFICKTQNCAVLQR